tara:strand:- start:1054 stop:2724 length:1671 start_codon:yes stop_codon:yes gene_type:complete
MVLLRKESLLTEAERKTAFVIAGPLLALLYAFYTVSYLLQLGTYGGEPFPQWLTLVTGPSALYFVWLTRHVHSHQFTIAQQHRWIGVTVVLVLVNVTVHYSQRPTLGTSVNYVLVMLGIGTMVSSRKWFIGLLLSCLACFVVTALVVVGASNVPWRQVFFSSASGALVSTFLFIVRRAAIQRVEMLTAEAEAKRLVAEEALVVSRRARADIQQILERAPDSVLVLVEGTIEYANQNFLDCLRRTEINVLGVPLESLVVAGSLDPLEVSRLTFQRDDGENVLIEFSKQANIDRDGVEAVLLIGRDITSADSQLQAKLQLADRLAAVGVLAAGVAHEINNPLAYVIGNLGALEDDELFVKEMSSEAREEFHELVADALHGARRVAAIVDDLNTIARRGDGCLEGDVARAVESSIRIAGPHFTQNAKLIIDVDEVPPVACNQGRLGQILLNLIVNAAHSLDPEKPNTITIRCRDLAGAGRVRIDVEDTGCGMAQATQQRILEPFYTTKDVGDGTGLGLYFCKNEIERAHGELSFTSEPGLGSCFSIYLPSLETTGHSHC